MIPCSQSAGVENRLPSWLTVLAQRAGGKSELAAWSPLVLAEGAGRDSELAGWFSPLLAQRAASEGPRWTRAVGADQPALVIGMSGAVGVAQAALVRKGVERKVKKTLATGKGRVHVERSLSRQARGMGRRRVSARLGLGG